MPLQQITTHLKRLRAYLRIVNKFKTKESDKVLYWLNHPKIKRNFRTTEFIEFYRKNLDKGHKYIKETLTQKIKDLHRKQKRIPSEEPTKTTLSFSYSRYADDWIILTNADSTICEQIKDRLKVWLKLNLSATLSEEKTLIINLKNNPAHFLGFEISVPRNDKIGTKSISNPKLRADEQAMLDEGFPIKLPRSSYHLRSKIAGKETYIQPDKSRLINRFYMKGYCQRNGFPKEIPWLAFLEPICHYRKIEFSNKRSC